MTVSTIGVQHPKVLVFDSLYNFLLELAEAQIASLLCTKQDKIKSIMDVQMQV